MKKKKPNSICKVLGVGLIFYFLFFIFSQKTYAQNFQNEYQVEYFLTKNQESLNTRVKFAITITNLVSDLYVKQFSLGFPRSFNIHSVRAYDDHVELANKVDVAEDFIKITIDLASPSFGKGSKNIVYLEFLQDNLFIVNGNVWEVIIPTVDEKENAGYKITVHLPENANKKISISKPKPDQILGNTITWVNPTGKTIYAVFGDVQHYQANLTYNLNNDRLIPVYTDIAFPPDTLQQKIFVDDIEPSPQRVEIDSDGNYLGRYTLKPKESKTVNFKGTVSVYANPREELIDWARAEFKKQKSYLLAPQKYWDLSQKIEPDIVSATPSDIYKFVTNTLSYDYDKINSGNSRLGATKVLEKPSRAVCMEFTDLFVSLGRQKGIYAREIEGYGFSQDAKLRPLSLKSDILHSWPEYYNEDSDLWVQVDPTWEDTSGIDYFSSFDLNHIAFAIHGQSSIFPPPAGTYKTQDSKDIAIKATSQTPKNKEKFTVLQTKFSRKLNDSQSYEAKITIKNQGNVYFWKKEIPIISQNLAIQPASLQFSPLAPYQEKTLTFTYKSANKLSKPEKANLSIVFSDSQVIQASFTIIPYYFDLAVKVSLILFVTAATLSIFFFLKRQSSKVSKP